MAVPLKKVIIRIPRKRKTGMPKWLLACGHTKGSWSKAEEMACSDCVRDIPPDIDILHRARLALCPTCRDGVVDAEKGIDEKSLTLTQSPGEPILYQHAVAGKWVRCKAEDVQKLIENILIRGSES